MSSSHAAGFAVASASATPAPVTTIFTPPAGCFSTFPALWNTCKHGVFIPPVCSWGNPDSCFPSGGLVYTATLGVNAGLNFGANDPGAIVTSLIAYSPAILPSGFSKVSKEIDGATTYVYGCLEGWVPYPGGGYDYCYSNLDGSYSVGDEVQGSGPVTAFMPQLLLAYQSTDLPKFTPVSAPLLPTSVLTSYEHSVSVSKSMHSHSVSISKSKHSHSVSVSESKHSAAASASRKAAEIPAHDASSNRAIAIGVSIGVLAALVGWVVILRRLRGVRKRV